MPAAISKTVLPTLYIRTLGLQPYTDTWRAMQAFTDQRSSEQTDELWLVQHPPVFTQGQAGKPEHLLDSGSIPVVHTDRGGQVTYHGPGQIVAYPLLNLRRLDLGVRALVTHLETSVIDLLTTWGVAAQALADAPGVYVQGRKIASLGLRVRRGCSFHGVSLNARMDLSPFQRINPCGYNDLQMTQLADLVDPASLSLSQVEQQFASVIARTLGMNPIACAGLPQNWPETPAEAQNPSTFLQIT